MAGMRFAAALPALAMAALLVVSGAASGQSTAAAPAPKNVTGAKATTLMSIAPPKLSVTVRFMLDGDMLSTEPACKNQTNTANCTLPKLHAEESKVLISYSVLPDYEANVTAHVMLKACYSNSSQSDRPWRKSSPIIAKSKKCPIVIKGGLPPAEDANVPWMPNENVATATYFVRAYVVRNATMNGTLTTTTYPVAFGDSGYFEIKSIDSRPKGMKIAAGICMVVGPLMFLGYFSLTYLRKKNV